MFTGMIEEKGSVSRIDRSDRSYRLTIQCKKVLEGTKTGDSISVNGACLTVVKMDSRSFQADVTPETMRRTDFSELRPGSPVNLERAVRLCDRLGGHLVLGHVDGTGKIVSLRKEGNAVDVSIMAPAPLMKYIIEKGSIAIDGISLTIASAASNIFTISVIPHTGEETTLLDKQEGNSVNIECDYVAKIIEHMMNQHGEQGLTRSMLESLRTGANYGR